jgi:hypothetical protein
MPRYAIWTLLTVACWGPAAVAGPQWVEGTSGIADAGDTIITAEEILTPVGTNSLTVITGSLTPLRGVLPDLADMYVFRVAEPMSFSISTREEDGGFAEFDANLWLFQVVNVEPRQANGLLANRDADSAGTGAAFIGRVATDGTAAAVMNPGVYAIAITGGDHVAVSNNGPIFQFGNPGEVSGPDGPGGDAPQVGFAGPGETGDYTIILTGSAPFGQLHAVPAVSDVGLALMGTIVLVVGSTLFRRRRAAV